ncbi:MAG: DUF3422 domain-containing protein [Gammaproteobacteria bacterium]|nr:DUF3422 domain-containing protein [Gammaproteobacteria bacterium]
MFVSARRPSPLSPPSVASCLKSNRHRFSLSTIAMLPEDHPQRRELNDEVHARPPGVLRAPARISYLALVSSAESRDEEWRRVSALAAERGVAAPAARVNHFSADLGGFTLRFERHAEFARYMFVAQGAGDDPFDPPALASVPDGFIAGLPGRVIVAAHGAFLPADDGADAGNFEALASRWFDGNALVGSTVGDGAATALTDFRIRADGFSRFLVVDHHATPRQAGRIAQRVLEIDTYRMMALLALPIARDLNPFFADCEHELSQVTLVLESAGHEDEAILLDRLTRLEAQIEVRAAENDYRFAAAAAYYDLVRRRIAELRERRIPGLQTFEEFTERRLAPAMNTCRTSADRQELLSQRVARANQLLATRVDITREKQNQDLLESMNRRGKAQLKLQQTVEGLSVAAVTYYVVGLIGHVVGGVEELGYHVAPEVVMAVSIPIIAGLAAIGINRIRHAVVRKAR